MLDGRTGHKKQEMVMSNPSYPTNATTGEDGFFLCESKLEILIEWNCLVWFMFCKTKINRTKQ